MDKGKVLGNGIHAATVGPQTERGMYNRYLLALAAGSLAAASASYAAQVSDVQIVKDEATVAGCEFVGEVKGSSAWGGLVTNIAYNRARDSLKKRALKLGATHVVLLDSSSGPAGSNMLGNAYKCPAQTPAARP